MDILIDDVLINILNVLTTKDLFKFCICNQSNFEFLKRNIKYFKFNISNNKITDKGLEYLKDVHIINLNWCYQITDKGLEYLKGVHTIDLTYCNKITDKGLEYLKGVHTINLTYCNKITDKGLEYLKGAKIYK